MEGTGFKWKLEKTAIILDMGLAYTKIGMVGEASPRFITETKIPLFQKLRNLHELKIDTMATLLEDKKKLKQELEEYLHILFNNQLQIDLKDRPIIILESLITPREIIATISEILYDTYMTPTIYYFLSNVLPLYLSASESGLIIDCGFLHTQMLALGHTEVCMESYRVLNVGGFGIKEEMRKCLIQDNPGIEDQITLTHAILEQVISKMVKVLSMKQSKEFFKSEEQIQMMKNKKFSITVENENEAFNIMVSYYSRVYPPLVFFADPALEKSEDSVNIAYEILSAISKCSHNIRTEIMGNIILTGGSLILPGFKTRLLQELSYLLDNHPKFIEMKKIKEQLEVFENIYSPNVASWMGASILGNLQAIKMFGYSRAEYTKKDKRICDRYGDAFLLFNRESSRQSVFNQEYEQEQARPRASFDVNAIKQKALEMKQIRKMKKLLSKEQVIPETSQFKK